MRHALRLAEKGRGETNPNPMVGCVVVRKGRVVGEGYHHRAGAPHAEVLALRDAGPRARGATLYVSLEPCVHRGRTGPCAPLVVRSGVARVVAAMRDPDTRVGGRGFALLRKAGIEVVTGVLGEDALALNEPFARAAPMWRPFVLLKVAMTLDARIATARGESRWITSPRQRRTARRLRRLFDGVLVGIGTVLADDPLLLPEPRVRRPFHRIVLDARLRIPEKSRLVDSVGESPLWVLTGGRETAAQRRLESLGVTVVNVPGAASGLLPLPRALRRLRDKGIMSVMVEGGSAVLGSFLREGLFDQLALFRAPILLGGKRGLPAFGGPDPLRLGDAVRLKPGSPPPTFSGADAEFWYPVD
jgi:diaminohydroxyphosphoribosylaminopyrimidine deaminase / 5-amino-6-(5-phosphoribosylamino)uracil reductase